MTDVRPLATSHSEERFRAMFAQYHPAIYGYAARRVGRVDANDVAAETFTIAWRRIRRVPNEPATLPWLYGVARNVVANLDRSRRRSERLVAKQAAYAGSESAVETVPDVVAALDRLQDDDKEILLLAAWEGLSPAEIGKAIGCSSNAAAVRLHRARGRLALAMEEI
ncbi:MAG: sigma-70 family RNA polymerase sigma factor [Acidimicrobiia bacterium]|nr:sigma-70 family RNA polymerase sigma factor [Acidimicrobiia bacterium]